MQLTDCLVDMAKIPTLLTEVLRQIRRPHLPAGPCSGRILGTKYFYMDRGETGVRGVELLVDIRRESSEMNCLNYLTFDSDLNKVESMLSW